MFLEFNEMKYPKGRYVPVVLVMVPIARLIFILSGLADGLTQGNRLTVDQWQANQVVLSKEANNNLNVLVLDENVEEMISGGKITPISQQPLAIRPVDDKKVELTNVNLFGIEKESFSIPKVIEGDAFTDKNQVIVLGTLKNQGLKIGDKLAARKYDEQLEIVGFISKSSYNIASVTYTSLDTRRSIKYGDNPVTAKAANGFIIRGKDNTGVKVANKDSQVLPILDSIEKLLGYSVQNLTLSGMIYFLIVIAVFIVSIFIFMMTPQKIVMFGVLRIQGVLTSFLAKVIVLRTALLAALKATIGLALTGITVLSLPEAMPYTTNGPHMILSSVLLISSTLIGEAFPIWTIAKIDPLIAIGD